MSRTLTPLCDFVREYAESDAHRLHMPGHKGVSVLGCEAFDQQLFVAADGMVHHFGAFIPFGQNVDPLAAPVLFIRPEFNEPFFLQTAQCSGNAGMAQPEMFLNILGAGRPVHSVSEISHDHSL